MPKKIDPAFYFIGNHPMLDFTNTRIAVNGKPLELLETFTDVLDWLTKAGLYSKEETEQFARRWEGAEGEAVVAVARALRSSLLDMVIKCKAGIGVSEEEMENINRLLAEQSVTTKLLVKDRRFVGVRQVNIRKPTDVLIPVAEAAVDFFSRIELQLVKKCENPDCVLHFYDNSKNSTRRWCSQRTCGNRMKVAAFLERRKHQNES